jgi:hypothetical protein
MRVRKVHLGAMRSIERGDRYQLQPESPGTAPPSM